MVLINGKNYNASSPVVKRLAPDQYVPPLSNQPAPVTPTAPQVPAPVSPPVATPNIPPATTPAPLPVAPIATTVENTMTPEQRQKMYDQLTSMNISPANIGTINEKTLLEATFSPEELAQMPYYQQISQREGQRTELQQGLTGGQIPQPSASMLRPLEEAIKTKIGLQKEQLGQSELFSASGIDPYVALSRSLQERSKEMGDKYNSYANLMSSVGENLSSSYGQALTNYKILQGQYDKEVERIDSIIKEEQAYKRQLDLMQKQQNYQDNPPVGSQRWYEKEQLKLQFGEAQRVYEDKYGTTWDAATFKIGEEVGWCGDYASTISTAPRVGTTWKEKRGNIDDKNVSVGDKLLIPMGVDKNGNGYGHVAVVLSYDPITGNIQVAESNKDGRQNRQEGLGIATFGTYNINTLEAKYPGWGVAHGELKQEYANANKGGLDKFAGGLEQVPKDLRTAVTTKANQFDGEQSVKNFQTTQEGWEFVQSIPNDTTNPADNQGLIYAFAKIMDPNSVVREGEYATVQKYSQSWAESFGFNAVRVLSNQEFLTEEAIKNMKATLEQKYKASEKSYDTVRNQYVKAIDNIAGVSVGNSILQDYKFAGSEKGDEAMSYLGTALSYVDPMTLYKKITQDVGMGFDSAFDAEVDALGWDK